MSGQSTHVFYAVTSCEHAYSLPLNVEAAGMDPLERNRVHL